MAAIRVNRKLASVAIGISLAISSAALHAQSGGRPSLEGFADAQRALGAASIDDQSFLNSLIRTIESGNVSFYFSVTALKSNEATRVALIRALGPSLPRIVASDMFGAMYATSREEAARARAGAAPSDPALARADAISELQMSIRDFEERRGVSGLSRRDRSAIESGLEDARTRVAQLQRQAQDPAIRAADQAQFQAATQAYEAQRQEALTALEADLPSDVRVLARRRLEAFVAGCRDVDFHARTATQSGVTRFVSAEDEARPRIWKMCFRAGSRTVTEARRVATRWIGTLPRPPRAPRH